MTDLTKNLMCVQIRSGIQIWVEHDRAKNLMQVLTNGDTKFIEFDGQIFNRADIVGVFNAGTMAEHTRRKNGEWQCAASEWHKRNQECSCLRGDHCKQCKAAPCLCEVIKLTNEKYSYPQPTTGQNKTA